jgi:hypothetical protein
VTHTPSLFYSNAIFSFLSLAHQIHPPEAYHPVATKAIVKSATTGNDNDTDKDDRWGACLAQIVEPLGLGGEQKKEANRWCNYSHLGQCSFTGQYQPEIPKHDSPYGHFFLIGMSVQKSVSNRWLLLPQFFSPSLTLVKLFSLFPSFFFGEEGGYVKIWEALGLDHFASTLGDLKREGAEVCALDKDALAARFGPFPSDDVITSIGQQLCFLSAFTFAMLHHGHGFDLERNFTAVTTMHYGDTLVKVEEEVVDADMCAHEPLSTPIVT